MKNVGLITGASSGIGKELARVHAQNGGDLVIVARSEDRLNALKEELEETYGVNVWVIAKDLAREEAPREIFDMTEQNGVRIDYLFNNAGFGDFGFFHETDWEKEKTMIDLNVKSLTAMTKLFGSEMVKRRTGKIMNLASTASFQPGPMMSIYYATKHYVLAFSEGIANEWKDFGVTVTALCPGPTASGFQEGADIESIKLVKSTKLPTSREVAEYGYRALQRNKRVAIHGLLNRLMAFSTRLMPKKITIATVRYLHSK